MQIKKETNLFACAVLFIVALAVGYQLGAPNNFPLDVSQPAVIAGLAIIMGLLLFCIWVLFDTVQAIVEPERFGLTSRPRWAACGLFTGLLYSAVQFRWIGLLGEHNVFRTTYEAIGSIVVFSLVFWLIFQRHIWTFSFKPNRRSSKVFGNLLLLGGLIILTGGLIMTASIRSWDLLILLALGFFISGLGLILAAVVILFGDLLAKKELIGWTSGGMIFAGIVFALLGVFLH